MAFPTSVNDQITDSVTQSDVKTLASAPSQAMGALYQSHAQAHAIAAHNATATQQAGHTILQAVTTACVSSLLGTGGGAGGAQK
jgi:hypothetical protein